MPVEKEIVSKRQLRRKIERKLKVMLVSSNISRNYISSVSTQLNPKDNKKLVFEIVTKTDSMCESDFINIKSVFNNKISKNLSNYSNINKKTVSNCVKIIFITAMICYVQWTLRFLRFTIVRLIK